MSLLRNPILCSTLAAFTIAACATSPTDSSGDDDDGKSDGTGETIKLENGVPVVISAIRDEARYFTIDVPEGQTFFTVTTRATDRDRDDGGVDLYARFEAAPTIKVYDYGSGSDTNAEQLFVPATAGTWHILAFGYTPFDDVELTASFNSTDAPRAWTLENGVAVEGVSAKWNDDVKPSFRIDVPAGKKNLKVDASWNGSLAAIHLQNARYKSNAIISDASTSQASLGVANDVEGTWFITPDPEFLGDIANLRVVASYEDDDDQGVTVTNGVASTLGSNDPVVYRIDVPEGQSWVRVQVAPGSSTESGDFQVRSGAKPTNYNHDFEGDFGSNYDGDLVGDVEIPVLEPGPVYVRVLPGPNGAANTQVTLSYSTEVQLPTGDIAFDSGDITPPDPEIKDNDQYAFIHEIENFNFGTIKSATVYLDLDHSYPGDLAITLKHNGSPQTLLLAPAKTSPNWTAVYRLNDLIGQPVSGTWRLTASDSSRIDAGRVNNWRVVVERE
ncbi:MAG: pre-peptidase C-terminal domain-containing protein [Kofleriaceae bacterium]